MLGANDGIVSVAGIVIGVAGATANRGPVFTAGWPDWSPGPCRWRWASTLGLESEQVGNGKREPGRGIGRALILKPTGKR